VLTGVTQININGNSFEACNNTTSGLLLNSVGACLQGYNKEIILNNLELKLSTTNIGNCFVLGNAGTIYSSTGNTGICYGGNYSSNYTNRTLVDKEYVDYSVTGNSMTASNGLSKIGTNITLGGSLTGNTTINACNLHDLLISTDATQSITGDYAKLNIKSTGAVPSISICSTDVTYGGVYLTLSGISATIGDTGYCFGGLKYLNNNCLYYTKRSIPDVEYVTGLTTTTGIQTANNGLNRIGTNVRLGGALTGNTAITGAYTLNVCGGAQLNTTLGYQISGSTILRTSPNAISSVFIGYGSGNNTSTGVNNIATGYQALYANITGSNNIATGYQALFSNVSGCHNNAQGCYALYYNTTGKNNTASGYRALYCNAGGSSNNASGFYALYSNTCGCNNIASGCYALRNNTTGKNNTASGYAALYCNTTGCNNTASGYKALRENTTGCNNTASGYNALYANTTGCNNNAFGNYALYCNSTGSNNTASGYRALYANTCGSNNNASGNYVLRSNTCGSNNNASGYRALNENTSGLNNTASGYNALFCNTTGSDNFAVGYKAGYSNVTGSTSIFLGNCAGYSETKSNRLYISNSSTTQPLIYGEFDTKCAVVHGAFKISGTTSLLIAPNVGTISDPVLVRNTGTGEIKTIASSSFGDRNNFYAKTTVITSTILTTGSTYVILVNHTAPVIITLPAIPLDGQVFRIKDAAYTALSLPITIGRNGKNIDRQPYDALINTDAGALELVYDSALGWFSFSYIN
jgi:hypothetical protein